MRAIDAVELPLSTQPTGIANARGGDRAAESASPTLRRLCIEFAVEGWNAGNASLYGAGLGLLLALLRMVDSETATRLHDANRRKPMALSPLIVESWPGRIGKATLAIATWERDLGEALARACDFAVDRSLTIADRPGCVLNAALEASGEPEDLIPTGPSAAVDVRFVTPTVFSLGRAHSDPRGRGVHRYGLLPSPGPVVGSWLRAWREAGGPCFGSEGAAAWIEERVAVRRISALHTVTVHAQRTALTGFVGEVAYTWVGPEPWGPPLLAALARFSAFCGTGAKTSYGLGQTRLAVDR